MEKQHQRARWHDYNEPGIYMLTLVADRRGTPFGVLEQTPEGEIRTQLTPLGESVRRQITELPTHAKELEVIRYVVMPDHIHVVVYVHAAMRRHLGQLVRGFKYGTTVAYLRELDARHGGRHSIQGSRPSERGRKEAALARREAADEPPHTGLQEDGEMRGRWREGKEAATREAATREAARREAATREVATREAATREVARREAATREAARREAARREAADEPPHTGLQGDGEMRGRWREGGSVGSGLSAESNCGRQVQVPPLWSEGYHDRILTGRNQLSRMLRYVEDNPRRGWIKRQHHNLFYNKRMTDIEISMEQARWLLRQARSLGVMHELVGVLVVEQRLGAESSWQKLEWWMYGVRADKGKELRACLHVKTAGNNFLLDESLLIPVRMSRSTPKGEIARQKADLLQRCECEGAVIVTPGVSGGEQEVLYSVAESGFNAIHLQIEAMSDVSAPQSRLFDAMTNGHLLTIAPWPDRPLSSRGNKGLFELLNCIAELLAARE